MSGYFRFPHLFKERLYFVSEDDVWAVDLDSETKRAQRLTPGLGQVSGLAVSPNGQHLALSMNEEGHNEIYLLPSRGGTAERLTYHGGNASVCAWTPDNRIAYASSHAQPFDSVRYIYAIDPESKISERMNVGVATRINFPTYSGKGRVIQRHGNEFGSWKRYQGGTAGQIWIDENGDGEFKRLHKNIPYNLSNPLWIADRLFFLSDHEGIGNLYSCWTDGTDLRRETNHEDYYVRQPATNGEKIVYHVAGVLKEFNPRSGEEKEIDFEYAPAGVHIRRKFVNPKRNIHHLSTHPGGHHLLLNVRSNAYVTSLHQGGHTQIPRKEEERHHFSSWCACGTKFMQVVRNQKGDHIEVRDSVTSEVLTSLEGSSIGRVCRFFTSPHGTKAALVNHRNTVIVVSAEKKKPTLKTVDRSEFGPIGNLSWSPDGNWLTYDFPVSRRQRIIKLADLKNDKTYEITTPILEDFSPSFDPTGKYIFFLSNRQFDAHWDTHHFEMSFPAGIGAYGIALDQDTQDPFHVAPKFMDDLGQGGEDDGGDATSSKKKESGPPVTAITLEGIQERIFSCPLPARLYLGLTAAKGKLYLIESDLEPAIDGAPSSRGIELQGFDIESRHMETICKDVVEVELNVNKEFLTYRDGDGDIRTFKAAEKPAEGEDVPVHKQGWAPLEGLKISVNPQLEWQQIYDEAWQLQRDFFWTEDMSKVNWLKIYNRYLPLARSVLSRHELNDVLWQMQGELGSSHAYVSGGDLPGNRGYHLGMLGTEFVWDRRKKSFIVTNLAKGDVWSKDNGSPLVGPGQHIEEGSQILSIDGISPTPEHPPEETLLSKAGQYVKVVVKDPSGKNQKTVHLKTLRSDEPLRYRDWVNKNRTYVHEKSKGKLGYIHIPDMSTNGYREFHRGFLLECDRDGLVVDVRHNRGGSVSQLLIEKLARKRLGYDVSRWNGTFPYPYDAPQGAMVALTNEYAGSDGDMFCHVFKMLHLGPLIGKRTWGGVIGIEPRHSFVDHGYTTQPEFSFWFKDVTWGLENHGAEPDIEVEISPMDYENDKDPQLDMAIQEALLQVKAKPPLNPDFSERPDLSLPSRVK